MGLDIIQETRVATGTVSITDAAAAAIKRYLAEKQAPAGAGLRIGVRGGGCSGLSYFLDVVEGPLASDHVIETHEVLVVVDPKSLLYLQGSELDFVTGLMESGFKFNNPNVGKSCGCGSSFTPS